MDISILIQARLSSSRLPGKILYRLGDKNFDCISLISKRLKNLKENKQVCIITSTETCDNCIEYVAKSNNLKCFRGSHEDVLERFYYAAETLQAKTIVRITSDCPLIDPIEIQRVLNIHLKNQNDYTSNTFDGSTIIDGFDVEVFSFEALKKAHNQALLPSEREHVTFYFRNNNFKLEYTDPNLNYPYTRLTLDTPEDFKAISILINSCKNIENITMNEIGKLYYELKLDKVNSHIMKNHGWKNSFIKDEFSKNN